MALSDNCFVVTRSCLQIPNGPPVSSTSLPVTTAPPVFTTTVTPATTTQFVSTLPPPFVSFSNDTSSEFYNFLNASL